MIPERALYINFLQERVTATKSYRIFLISVSKLQKYYNSRSIIVRLNFLRINVNYMLLLQSYKILLIFIKLSNCKNIIIHLDFPLK